MARYFLTIFLLSLCCESFASSDDDDFGTWGTSAQGVSENASAANDWRKTQGHRLSALAVKVSEEKVPPQLLEAFDAGFEDLESYQSFLKIFVLHLSNPGMQS